MRVETVGFITRVRLPNGKHETSISLQNQHHRLSYEITIEPKVGIVTIKSIKAPFWTSIIPMTNCAFINLANQTATARRTRSNSIPNPVEGPPRETVLVSSKQQMKPRLRGKNGA